MAIQYYSDSDFWAVIGRISFVFMAMVIIYASFSPPSFMFRIIYSYHLEHFAVFYMFALSATAAFVRRDVFKIGIVIWFLAFVIEAIRWFHPEHKASAIVDWFADVAGVAAALVPVGIGRFREAFQPSP